MSRQDQLKARVTYGLTLNLGNYQSARIEYSFEYYLDELEPQHAFARARKAVEEQAEAQKA